MAPGTDKIYIKPIYFSLYDNFTKEGIIPNGINMSIDEYNKHRYQIDVSYTHLTLPTNREV